jgi:hypothetical protein
MSPANPGPARVNKDGLTALAPVDHLEVAGPQQHSVASSLGHRGGGVAALFGAVFQQQEQAMKLNAAQLERTTTQLQAEPIPEDHPLIPQLNQMYGEHTYFLDSNGLNIVEPAAAEVAPNAPGMGVVVNLANWTNSNPPKLEAHEPELTESMVSLETDGGL